MDLERCPRCGSKWMGGEFCPNCKFIPIGAGLKPGQKKKKRKNRYVEPGSSRGFLTFIFLVLVGIGAFKYQPWKDDWEFVRALFGKGRHHSLVGEWEVVKTITINKQQGMVARDNVEKGSFTFTPKGSVNIDLMHPQSQTTAAGKYEVEGTIVALRDLRTTGDSSEDIKTVINMNLAWSGNDNVIAMDKTEAIYLKRRKTGSPLSTFMQMGLKPGEKPDDGKAPSEMRGVFGDMKRSTQETEKMANEN
jgi:hypothetical protein